MVSISRYEKKATGVSLQAHERKGRNMIKQSPTTAKSGQSGKKTVYWVASSHWDREWYEPFQGFRYRLVKLLDTVLDLLERRPGFSHFQMDGQSIPIEDYLEIRPENESRLRALCESGQLVLGPWYVLPDEFLVSGESLVRNLKLGMEVARSYGGRSSKVGFVCDIFGHNSQLPQILTQFGIKTAFIWRGTEEEPTGAHLRWRAPDNSEVIAHRFGPFYGYVDGTYALRGQEFTRDLTQTTRAHEQPDWIEKFRAYMKMLDTRGAPGAPILFFDGSDHLEIEPATPEIMERLRNDEVLGQYDWRMATLDQYANDLQRHADQIQTVIDGELRLPGKPIGPGSKGPALIPGVLSSRISLKQANARCENILTQWAEPFSLFARQCGLDYPAGFLNVAWRHLLANHAHDSICGCSIDQVHQDMSYRSDQAQLIGERLKTAALEQLAASVAQQIEGQPKEAPAALILIANPGKEPIDEPIDLTVSLPEETPVFQEFFGYEPKPGFRFKTEGRDLPYQRNAQRVKQREPIYIPEKLPKALPRYQVDVTARLKIPAFGYCTIAVHPIQAPTRDGRRGLSTGSTSAENELIAIELGQGGMLTLVDKASDKRYEGLLELEDRADIGDGWYHGIAVNDEVFTSQTATSNISCVADGPEKTTFRMELNWSLPCGFDFQTMRRLREREGLRIEHEVTLRAGSPRVEVHTTVHNTVRDHRLRVMFPTGAQADHYWADSPFDAVRRPIALHRDQHKWRELELETKPQQSWTAVYGAGRGLAIFSTGLPESAVRDLPERPIALTLFRGFGKTVMTSGEEGGQELGQLDFDYWIAPLQQDPDPYELTRLGQRLGAGLGRWQLDMDQWPARRAVRNSKSALSESGHFLQVTGRVNVTGVKAGAGGSWIVRLYNPGSLKTRCSIARPSGVKRAWSCDLNEKNQQPLEIKRGKLAFDVPPRRIMTIKLK
jgi:hypothetical protein